MILAQLSKNLSQLYIDLDSCGYLDEVLAPSTVPKMIYSDFFTQITMRHHVIYEEWPVSKFCSPGKLTLLELRRLFHVLKTGSPLFRRLSSSEWDALDLESFQARHATISATAAVPFTPTLPPTIADDPDPARTVTPTAGSSSNENIVQPIVPATAPPLLPPIPPAELTLVGGQVCKPTQRRRRWDAGLTREQAAALKVVREAEKAAKKKGGRNTTSQTNPQ